VTAAFAPDDPRAHVAGQLRDQARSCTEMGSPLYARILEDAARDVEAGGPAWDVLRGHLLPGRGDALALRLMAAVHRLVLAGRAPRLARHYPSAGGTDGVAGAWDAFREVLATQADALQPLLLHPCQTNEVGRCAALMWGFLEVAAVAARPLRVLEAGASAGLMLRFDRYRYGGGGASWGDPSSPVDLAGLWAEAPAHAGADIVVAERRGCDPNPLDPGSEETRVRLMASVWADQADRFGRLRAALDVAASLPATVDAASVDEWLPAQVARAADGLATVVYHSVMDEYLPAPVRERFHATLREAATRASFGAPFAWLRLEPTTGYRALAVSSTTWPGGRERVLAICGAHGADVRSATGL